MVSKERDEAEEEYSGGGRRDWVSARVGTKADTDEALLSSGMLLSELPRAHAISTRPRPACSMLPWHPCLPYSQRYPSNRPVAAKSRCTTWETIFVLVPCQGRFVSMCGIAQASLGTAGPVICTGFPHCLQL